MSLCLAHPELIADHSEDLGALEFASADPFGRDLARLRSTMLDMAQDESRSTATLRATLVCAGFGSLLAKLDANSGSAWYLRPEAATVDASAVFRQALALQHKAQALHNELLSAEAALASNASDANVARMRDIREQLSALTGMEAAVEGFGTSSGRSETSV